MLKTRRPVMAQKLLEGVHIATSAGGRYRDVAIAWHMCPASGPQLNDGSVMSQTDEMTINGFFRPSQSNCPEHQMLGDLYKQTHRDTARI